jgi:hypothetical protein
MAAPRPDVPAPAIEIWGRKEAQRALDECPEKRPPNDKVVGEIVEDMRAGRWRFTGDELSFTGERAIANGVNRLHALVIAGIDLPFVAVRGVVKRDMIDRHKKRRNADALKADGVEHEYDVASTAAVVATLATGRAVPRPMGDIRAPYIRAMLDMHPGIVASVERCVPFRKLVSVPKLSAWHFLAGLADPAKAEEFLSTLGGKDPGRADHPAWTAHRYIAKIRARKGFDASVETVYSALVKAWNAFYEGRPLRQVQIADHEPPELIAGMPSVGLPPTGEASVLRTAERARYQDEQVAAATAATVELAFVTPDMAREWLLESNDGNRRADSYTYEKYKRDMLAGHWEFNGQTIKFGRPQNGRPPRMLNGQHRATGCDFAHREDPTFEGFWCVVVRGLEDDVFDVLDMRTPRKVSDPVKARGVASEKIVTAALRVLVIHDAGEIMNLKITPSIPELLDKLREDDSVARFPNFLTRLAKEQMIGDGSDLVAIWQLLRRDGGPAAEEFMRTVMTGLGLSDVRDPRYVLRIKLQRDYNDRKAKKARLNAYLAVWVKAWNLHVRGARTSRLTWERTEGFPEILPEPGEPAAANDARPATAAAAAD